MPWRSPVEMYEEKHGAAALQELHQMAEEIAAELITEIEAERREARIS